MRHWYESTVVGVNWDEKKVKVHYKGWAERWDEWLPMDSDRLARQNTHTTGTFMRLADVDVTVLLYSHICYRAIQWPKNRFFVVSRVEFSANQ